MAASNSLHKHDLVRVEDAEHGVAWETCKSCPHVGDPEPWEPVYAAAGDPLTLDVADETGKAAG